MILRLNELIETLKRVAGTYDNPKIMVRIPEAVIDEETIEMKINMPATVQIWGFYSKKVDGQIEIHLITETPIFKDE